MVSFVKIRMETCPLELEACRQAKALCRATSEEWRQIGVGDSKADFDSF